MPPVTKAGSQQFRKDVEFAETKASDEYELEASGIVMVPDKADLQNDFAREETIREFADQFETFEEAGQAGGGIMHAVFPDGWMELEHNEVLEEAEEIGEKTVKPGAWVQRWGINNAQLAELIDENILEGYSIGAIQVDWNGPHDQGDLDNVDTSEIPDDELVYELSDGIIREVSAVDIPAVPDAQILEAKGLDKRLADHVGNQEAFVEEAMERGHSEAEAERLWDVLNAAVEAEGSSEPGKQSVFARAGKAFLSALSGPDDDETDAKTSEATEQTKEGRTLSTANQNDLKASIDAAVSILDDAGVEHGITRFTDREDDSFDLSEHTAREFANPDDEDVSIDDVVEGSTDNDATGGDTPDPDDTTNMSDDNPDDDPGEDKSLAEKNAEQINELTDAVNDLTESISGPEPKTAEIEIGDETYEVPEEKVKAALGVDEETDVADAIERLNAEVEQTQQRLDLMNQQSGQSAQIDAAATEENGDEDALKGLGEALS